MLYYQIYGWALGAPAGLEGDSAETNRWCSGSCKWRA